MVEHLQCHPWPRAKNQRIQLHLLSFEGILNIFSCFQIRVKRLLAQNSLWCVFPDILHHRHGFYQHVQEEQQVLRSSATIELRVVSVMQEP